MIALACLNLNRSSLDTLLSLIFLVRPTHLMRWSMILVMCDCWIKSYCHDRVVPVTTMRRFQRKDCLIVNERSNMRV